MKIYKVRNFGFPQGLYAAKYWHGRKYDLHFDRLTLRVIRSARWVAAWPF